MDFPLSNSTCSENIKMFLKFHTRMYSQHNNTVNKRQPFFPALKGPFKFIYVLKHLCTYSYWTYIYYIIRYNMFSVQILNKDIIHRQIIGLGLYIS